MKAGLCLGRAVVLLEVAGLTLGVLSRGVRQNWAPFHECRSGRHELEDLVVVLKFGVVLV